MTPTCELLFGKTGARIAALLVSIFTSQSLEDIALRLEGASAQYFLDVVQSTLDKGLLRADEHCRMARRMIRKLCASGDMLPSTLFITGITGKEQHPTFGGAYGDIYRASYDDQIVALKYMRAVQFMRGSDLREIRRKFCREAFLWKSLHHPHILPFLGIDQDTFPLSLVAVSPWMEHGTIMNYLKKHGHENVDKFLYEIAQGLQYLHSCGIVHGDLRGSNILIDEDWSACLADFGLSILSDATATSTNQGGSLYWMAPELLAPDRFGMKFTRTPASDVFAFGCVCFELYTGRPPFGDLPEPAALIKVITGKRQERSFSHPAMSDLLWQHITTCWDQNPIARPITEIVVQKNGLASFGHVVNAPLSVPSVLGSTSHNNLENWKHDLSPQPEAISHYDEKVRLSETEQNEQISRELRLDSDFRSIISPYKLPSFFPLGLIPNDRQAERWREAEEVNEQAEDSDQEESEDMTRFVNLSLLSNVAVHFLDQVPCGTQVKGGISYSKAFTGEDVVVEGSVRPLQDNAEDVYMFLDDLKALSASDPAPNREPLPTALSSELGLANDPKLRAALRTDDRGIATLLQFIFCSEPDKEAVLRLEGDSAQFCLDVVQDFLDKGFLLEHGEAARRIIRKVSEACDKLPSSLFITGVSEREENATFGGGYGDIYRASHGGKHVALKRLRHFLRGSDLRRVRLKFCREALIWRDLHHPYILQFLGIDRDSFPEPYFCMHMALRMSTNWQVSCLFETGRFIYIKVKLYEIAQGLQYLHSRNIVHGDLRGANILINDDWSACLADFGLSSFSDSSSSTSARGGSLYWMAPELFDPDRFGYKFTRTPATDVYAFGCVCLELYTGQHPFANLSEPAALLKVIDGERPERPSSPAMSDVFWKHITEYWAQDPMVRPPTDLVVKNMVWPVPSTPKPQQNQGLEPRDEGNELVSKIGYLTTTASMDWTLILDVCDNVSATEANAKEAVRALRREFKYGESTAQFAAARLWAIMLHNTSETFISQSTTPKFLKTIEELLTSSRTSFVVRERVMDVLGAAAYTNPSEKDPGFRRLWRRVKPYGKPEEGVPLDAKDTILNPPLPSTHNRAGRNASHHDITPIVPDTPPVPPDEDIQRLLQECRIGVGNANLLMQALSVAAPEVLQDAVVAEFHKKCKNSQELIIAQIPWATAGVECSRAALDHEEGSSNPNWNGNENLADLKPREEVFIREELLEDLLAANARLLEVLKLYDDLERVTQERERELPDYRDIDQDNALHMDTRPFLEAQRTHPPAYTPSPATDYVSPTQLRSH
ncbi:Kinase-like protein [Mycena sanguinolenta]|uniref:Kinase-like protein n=1 Tax=Mycena sanguinolenta TaxID=230812 RepID=A0A8H7DGE7_9AGAR|nr:Kinase-like protein [Mycena sanguinolenta]